MVVSVEICFKYSGSIERMIDRKNDAFMFLLIDLCQVMTFELIDQENVPVIDIIEIIVDQKLLSPGDRIINLIAVMDVHIHGFFIII